MKVILEKAQIDQAIREYIANVGINTAGKEIEIDLTTVRKPEPGYSATVEIVGGPATAVPKPQVLHRSTSQGTTKENKPEVPEETTATVEEDSEAEVESTTSPEPSDEDEDNAAVDVKAEVTESKTETKKEVGKQQKASLFNK